MGDAQVDSQSFQDVIKEKLDENSKYKEYYTTYSELKKY
jgi:hypothetical protein